MSRLLVALSCLGAALISAGEASAVQPEKPEAVVTPTEGEVELARKLYREGKELRAKGELQRSLDKLKAAHDLVPTPITRVEYAQGLILLGNLVEGHALLVRAAKMARDPSESDKARRARDEAAKLAPKVDARIPRLVLQIADAVDGVAPSGGERATLELDGRAIRDAELGAPMPVNPGEHVLKVIAPASTRTERFRIDEAETRTIAVATRTTPGSSEVKETARETARAPERAPGDRPRAPRAPDVPPSERGGTSPLAPIGFVLGAVGITTGAVTGTVALVAADKVKDNCRNLRCPPEYHADLDLSTYMGTTATVAFVVGGAGLVVGTIALFAGSDPEPAITFAPVVSPGYAGLRGAF